MSIIGTKRTARPCTEIKKLALAICSRNPLRWLTVAYGDCVSQVAKSSLWILKHTVDLDLSIPDWSRPLAGCCVSRWYDDVLLVAEVVDSVESVQALRDALLLLLIRVIGGVCEADTG